MISTLIAMCGLVFLLLDKPVEACAIILLAIFWKLDDIHEKLK